MLDLVTAIAALIALALFGLALRLLLAGERDMARGLSTGALRLATDAIRSRSVVAGLRGARQAYAAAVAGRSPSRA